MASGARALTATEFIGERALAEHLCPAALDRVHEGAPAAADGQDGVGVQYEAGVGTVGGAVSVDLARRLRADTEVELSFGEADFDDSAVGEAVQGAQQREGEPVRSDRVRRAAFVERGGAPPGERGEHREQSAAVLTPGRSACRSVYRRGPASSSRTISRVHRSPTESRARAVAQNWS